MTSTLEMDPVKSCGDYTNLYSQILVDVKWFLNIIEW